MREVYSGRFLATKRNKRRRKKILQTCKRLGYIACNSDALIHPKRYARG